MDRDKIIKQALQERSVKVTSYKASLLWEPWSILKSDGAPHEFFTLFYKKDGVYVAHAYDTHYLNQQE